MDSSFCGMDVADGLARLQDSADASAERLEEAAEMAREVRRNSRSPSAVSEEDMSFCGHFLAPPAETPSTAVPDDDEDASPKTGSRCESAPPRCEVPENVRSKLGRPPVLPGSSASSEGSTKGLKARVCDLESEIRELSRRLSSIHQAPDVECKNHILGSSEALVAEVRCQAEMFLVDAREECREVMTHLAQELSNEVEAMADPKRVFAMMQDLETEGPPKASAKTTLPAGKDGITDLRKEVSTAVESLRKDLRSNTEALRAELSSMVAAPVKDMRKALEEKVNVQQAEFVKLRQELEGDFEGMRGDIQKLKKNATNVPAGASGGETSDFTRSWPGNLQNGRPPTLEHDLSRGRLRPRPSSSSAAKRRGADASSTCSDADGNSSECLQGLVGAFGAMARLVGLFKDGSEKLGEGEWEWARAGQRLEQAWALQTKDLWQFGMPLRPTLVDFLRLRTENGLSRGAGAATKLPDRREGARLAERLASGLTAANCPSSSLFSDIDSAVRQLSQYGKDMPADAATSKPGAAARAGHDPSKTSFAGLEALRQMRKQQQK